MAEKAEIVLSAVDKTKAAFNSAKKGLGDLDGATAGLAARFGTIGVAIAAAVEGVNYKNVIDGADQLNDLAESTGIVVERLAELKFAGQLNNAAIEELGKGVQKLNVHMAAAAGGSKESAAVFKSMGVELRSATGAMRSNDDILGDIADRFASYTDGAEKAALAQAIFGKSGAQLIPFLNNGRAGLEALSKEARELGVVFGSSLAKEAAAFNDNLDRLKAGVEGSKVAILNDMLPTLNKFVSELVVGRQVFGSFTSALGNIGLRTAPFETYGEGAADARRDIEQLNKELTKTGQTAAEVFANEGGAALISKKLFGAGGAAGLTADLDRANKRLEYFKRLQAAEALRSGEGIQDERRFQPAGKTTAPILDKLEAERKAAERKAMEGRLKALQDGLADERDLLSFQQQYLERVYADGVISVRTFYDEKDKAQAESLARQKASIDAQIAEQRRAVGRADTPEARAEAENKVADLLRSRTALEREAAQAGVVAAGDRARATEQLRRSVADLDAQLAELNGDTYSAAISRIKLQTEDFRKTFTQAGSDPGKADQLGAALANQAKLNQLRDDYARITERAGISEERLLLAAERDGKSRAEVEADVKRLRTSAIEQLDKLIEKTETLNKASTNPEVLTYLEQLRLARERAASEADPQLKRIQDGTREAGNSVAQSLENATFEGTKLSQVLKQIVLDLARIAFQEGVTKPSGQAFGNFFRGLFNSSSTSSTSATSGPQLNLADTGGYFGSANGNAFGQNRVHAFAQGGAFTNRIFSKPTFFKFRNGGRFSNGVMGEAGDEAVMPLARGRNGKLGVMAQASPRSGAGMPPIVNLHNNGAPAQAQVKSSTDSQGRLTLDVILDAFVDDAQRGGKFSQAQQSVYGMRRVTARR